MKKIVIFDLDGTILDTLTDLKNSVNYVLKSKNLKIKTLEEIRSYVGNGIELLMRRALPKDISEEEFSETFLMFKKYYEVNIQNETKPYPNIIRLFQELKTNGYLITVVSNKFQAGVDKLIGEFFNEYVTLAIGTSKFIRPKPHLDSINYIYQKLNVLKEDKVVFVGDSEVDIKTARCANLPIISVTWGFRLKEELKIYCPNYLVDEPLTILDILKNY